MSSLCCWVKISPKWLMDLHAAGLLDQGRELQSTTGPQRGWYRASCYANEGQAPRLASSRLTSLVPLLRPSQGRGAPASPAIGADLRWPSFWTGCARAR